MRRVVPLLLLPLLLAAHPLPLARAEDAPPVAPASQEARAKALAQGLLSADPVERALAAVSLGQALDAATDRAAFLRALTEALAARADAPERLEDLWIARALTGTPEQRAQAEAVVAALGPAARERLERARAVQVLVAEPAPAAPAPAPALRVAPPPASPQPPAPPPAGAAAPQRAVDAEPAGAPPPPAELALWVTAVTIPAGELENLRRRVAGSEAAGVADAAQPLRGPLASSEPWTDTLQQVADAQLLGRGSADVATGPLAKAHLGSPVVYRCCVEPAQGQAWAVRTDTIQAGLSVEAVLAPDGLLRLAAVWVEVLQPMPIQRTRPAAGVDPIELDRPDWSATRARFEVRAAREGGTLLLTVPGLLPDADRAVALVVTLRPAR